MAIDDFLPLTQETMARIRERIDTDVNAGIDPMSDRFIDVTEGGFYFDLTQAVALEIARLWDFASTEVPAVAFPAYAWGEYLDEHGEALGLERKDSARATGVVRFTGTDEALVAVGTEVATTPVGDDNPIFFTVTQDGRIGEVSTGVVDLAVEAVDAGSIGNVLANNVTVLASPNSGVSAVTNPNAITGGADVESDEDYRGRILLELANSQGAGTIADYERWALSYPGIGSAKVTPVWDGAGTVHVVVADSEQQPVGDIVQYGLQDQLDPPTFLTETTSTSALPAAVIDVATTGGAQTSGTFRLADQEIAYTGLTAATFTGCTGGTGTLPAGTRVAQGFGEGRGLAPIGAIVTVDTVTGVPVTVSATVTFGSGFSLGGEAGTIPTLDDLTTEIQAYLGSLAAGDDVVLKHVESRFFRVRGVLDVADTLLNGAARNVAIDDLEVAQPSTIALT